MLKNGRVENTDIGRQTPARGRFTSIRAAVSAAKTTAYTTADADFFVPCDGTGGAFTVTLLAAASAFANGVGAIQAIKKIDSSANAISVATTDGGTIVLSSQYSGVIVQSNGTVWYVIGNI